MEKIKSLLGKIAPWLAAAATGPAGLAGMAIKTIATSLGDENASADDLPGLIAGASPEQLKDLQQANLEFKVRMQTLGFQHETDLIKLVNDDRANARDREIKTGDSLTPQILAGFVTIGFFGILITMMTKELPTAAKDPALLLLGALSAAFGAVINYYFGSSSGSARKTRMLANSSSNK